MPSFSLYWLQHYKDLPENDWSHGQLQRGDFDYDWMREKGLRAAGIDDNGHSIWVDPNGIVYYDTDLKIYQGDSQDADNDNAPQPDNNTASGPNNSDNGSFSPVNNPSVLQNVTQPATPPAGYQIPAAFNIPAFSSPGNAPAAGSNSNIIPSHFAGGSGFPGNTRNLPFNLFPNLPDIQNSGLPIHPLVLQSLDIASNPVLGSTGIVANNNVVLSGNNIVTNTRPILSGEDIVTNEDRTTLNPVSEQNATKQENKGKGTRVFLYDDEDYCKPRFTRDDGQWAVFICFESNKLNEVKQILQKDKRKNNQVFKENKKLAELGGFYPLDELEQFGIDYMGRYKAEYAEGFAVAKMTEKKMNGVNWEPTAEVIRALAVDGSYLYPAGKEVHEDEYGTPNVTKTDRSKLNFSESPPSGQWTFMTIHIHPIGLMPKPINTKDECVKTKVADTFTFYYGNVTKYIQARGGPSGGNGDSGVQLENEAKSKKKYRSAIVDRHFLYLYSSQKVITIRRKQSFGQQYDNIDFILRL